jgi:hypothetical protein
MTDLTRWANFFIFIRSFIYLKKDDVGLFAQAPDEICFSGCYELALASRRGANRLVELRALRAIQRFVASSSPKEMARIWQIVCRFGHLL